jgi:nucleoside-diphosphate-sugar epimerase
MKKKILIFGAGSIGNHFANASLKKNYEIYVTDIDNSALKRMKEKIFPSRYKKWDDKINLIDYKFDLSLQVRNIF